MVTKQSSLPKQREGAARNQHVEIHSRFHVPLSRKEQTMNSKYEIVGALAAGGGGKYAPAGVFCRGSVCG